MRADRENTLRVDELRDKVQLDEDRLAMIIEKVIRETPPERKTTERIGKRRRSISRAIKPSYCGAINNCLISGKAEELGELDGLEHLCLLLGGRSGGRSEAYAIWPKGHRPKLKISEALSAKRFSKRRRSTDLVAGSIERVPFEVVHVAEPPNEQSDGDIREHQKCKAACDGHSVLLTRSRFPPRSLSSPPRIWATTTPRDAPRDFGDREQILTCPWVSCFLGASACI